jgi:hypothetical protein
MRVTDKNSMLPSKLRVDEFEKSIDIFCFFYDVLYTSLHLMEKQLGKPIHKMEILPWKKMDIKMIVGLGTRSCPFDG